MNYKNEIEKIAAQTMPHMLPNGQVAIPRGYQPTRYTREEMNDMTADMYDGYTADEIRNLGIEMIPHNLKPVADGEYDTILADDQGNLSNYNWEEGMMTGPIGEDAMTDLYTPVESEYTKAFGKLDKNTIFGLAKNRDSEQIYRGIGMYDDNRPKEIRSQAIKTMLPSAGGAALTGGAVGGVLGLAGGLKGAGIGAGIGSALIGGAVLADKASQAINPRKTYRDQLSSQAISSYYANRANEEFLSQYREASEYKAEIEKIAKTRV